MTPGRWLAGAVLGAGLLFAAQGGEYSTLALRKLRADERAEAARITELRRVVDSLTRYAKLVETDLETQERIAREQHGMLKRGEHAFILEEGRERQP
jgi:cell division protein FtsB